MKNTYLETFFHMLKRYNAQIILIYEDDFDAPCKTDKFWK